MNTPIEIETIQKTTYKVRPIFIDIVHELPYEGPCRFGKGKELEPEFDMMINDEAYKGFLMGIQHNMPEGVEILEPHRYRNHTENWRISEVEMRKLCEGQEDTDFYFLSTTGRTGEMFVEFAQMVNKPVAFIGNDFGITINTSAMKARGIECYAFVDWESARKQLRVLRARKALANLRVMCVTRFNGNLSYHCANDSFIDLEDVHKKLGTKFRYVNLHELIDQLAEIDPTTNYTTPGRHQENINADDMKEVEKIVDELMNNAETLAMTKENMIPSVKMYYLIQKLMKANECNAFTAPCPDACSTCRINKERFTFCISHSLNNENGIPSACEYDVAAVVSKAALQAIAGKPSYMGNTAVLTMPDGSLPNDGVMMHFSKDHIGQEKWDQLNGTPNMIMTGHSVANRKMKGFDADPAQFAIRPFAYSGFGVTMRQDFDQDAGQPVTMCRFDATCNKLFVSKGILKGGFGYDMDNCTLGSLIQVEDSKRFFKNQIQVGNHIPFVYGEYFDELVALGEALGLEVLIG